MVHACGWDPLQQRKIVVAFYRSRAGPEPVREWLKEAPAEDRKIIGTDLKRVQEHWPIGMPVCKALGGGLWEVRSTLAGNRIARLLFCFQQETVVMFFTRS
jgi:phage-related protein